MSEYDANAKIARIMGWLPDEKKGYGWNGPNSVWSGKCPDYCHNDNLAAKFRQYTMQQAWCTKIELNAISHGPSSWEFWCKVQFINKVGSSDTSMMAAHKESLASSVACVEAWQFMSTEELAA